MQFGDHQTSEKQQHSGKKSNSASDTAISEIHGCREPSEPPPPYTAENGRPFPQALNLYRFKDGWKGSIYHLGPHQKQPLMAVEVGKTWHLRPTITLDRDLEYKGSGQQQPLAIITQPERLSSKSSIELPGRGESFPLSQSSSVYRFIISVPQTQPLSSDAGPWPEKFEWRPSRGKEVRQIEKFGDGWKLVRLGRSVSQQSKRDVGVSSDGKEIVAVCAEYDGWSMKKTGRLCFLGSGATGELGADWAILATASALKIHHRETADE